MHWLQNFLLLPEVGRDLREPQDHLGAAVVEGAPRGPARVLCTPPSPQPSVEGGREGQGAWLPSNTK